MKSAEDHWLAVKRHRYGFQAQTLHEFFHAIVTRLTSGVDAKAVVEEARRAETHLHSLGTYDGGCSGSAGLLFGYGAINLEGIDEGLARLRRVMLR